MDKECGSSYLKKKEEQKCTGGRGAHTVELNIIWNAREIKL